MFLRILTDLIKLRITIASTITTALGYTMARGGIDTNIIPVSLENTAKAVYLISITTADKVYFKRIVIN